MNIILDAAVIIIFAIAIFGGYYNGFVKMILNFFGGIACFIVTLIYTPTLAAFLDTNYLNGFFKGFVTDKLTEILNATVTNMNIEQLFSDKPQEFIKLLEKFNINITELQEKLDAFLANGTGDAADYISGTIVTSLSYAVAYVVSFIAILIVATLLLKLIIWLCDIVFKLPVLRTADTLLGMITGALLGVLFVYVFCMLAEYLMPYLTKLDNPFFNDISMDNTLIYKLFASNNLLQNMLSSFI